MTDVSDDLDQLARDYYEFRLRTGTRDLDRRSRSGQ